MGDKPFTTQIIRFSGPNLAAWLNEMAIRDKPEFRIPNSLFIHQGRHKLLRLVTQQPPNWECRAHLILTDILSRLLIIRKPLPFAQEDLPKPIRKVLHAVKSDPDSAWAAGELPRVAGVSYSRLRDLFREKLHKPIHAFLQQQRLDRACELLVQGNLNGKQIAEKLHFGNEFYFSSFFKAQTGTSPTQFRKHAGAV